jgi:hypothetical protein
MYYLIVIIIIDGVMSIIALGKTNRYRFFKGVNITDGASTINRFDEL